MGSMAGHPVKLCLFAGFIIAVKYCHVTYVPPELFINGSYEKQTKKGSQPKENVSISSFWDIKTCKKCHDSDNCVRTTPHLYLVRLRYFIGVRVRGSNLLAVRIVNVIGKSTFDQIEQHFVSNQPEEATVFENGASVVQSARIAGTLWVPDEHNSAITLQSRLSRFTVINFTNAKQPLIMSYHQGSAVSFWIRDKYQYDLTTDPRQDANRVLGWQESGRFHL